MDETTITAEPELTEFEAIEVESIKGVPTGANGFPHLLLKGLADPEPDAEAVAKADAHGHPGHDCWDPDGDGDCDRTAKGDTDHDFWAADGTQKKDVPGKPMAAKAMGNPGCGCCPNCTADAAKGAEASDDGEDGEDGEDAAKAKLSAAERNSLDDSDFAIPESREYPIHDENHARNALARVAQHGTPSEKRRVRAAVHKKYPDIDKDGDTSKSAVAAEEATVQDDAQETGSLSKAVEDAVTKALAPLSDRIKAVEGDLAKVLAAPRPGGPVLSAVRPQAAIVGEDHAAKAAYYREKAETVTDPAERAGYRQLAREAATKAQTATA